MKNKKDSALLLIALPFLVFFSSCSYTPIKQNRSFLELKDKLTEELNFIDTNYTDILAHDYVIHGSTLQMQYRFAESILEFQEALKYDSSAAIYYAIAKSYKGLGKYDKSIEYSLLTLQKDSTFLPAIELIGEILISEYKFSDAIKVYEQLCTSSPNKNYKITLARLYEFEKPAEAVSLYEKVLSKDNEPSLLERLPSLYERLGLNEKKAAAIARLYHSNPLNMDYFRNYLITLLEAKKYNEAFDLVDSSDYKFTSEELNKIYFSYLYAITSDTSFTDDAQIKRMLSKINNRFRYDISINFFAVNLADRIKDSTAISRYIEHLLKIGDSIPEVPLRIGVFYMQKNDYISALYYFKKYKADFPDDYRFYSNSGLAYYLLDSIYSALSNLEQSIKINPGICYSWIQMGDIYKKIQNEDSSDYCYEKALSIEPGNPIANNNYAYSLSLRGNNLDEALRMSREALSYDSSNVSYLDTYGWIHYKLGNYDSAMVYISKSIELGASTSEVFEHLGELYMKLNEIEKSIKAYKKALETDPQNVKIINRIRELENR